MYSSVLLPYQRAELQISHILSGWKKCIKKYWTIHVIDATSLLSLEFITVFIVLMQLSWVTAAVIVARTRQRKNVVRYAKKESVLQVGLQVKNAIDESSV